MTIRYAVFIAFFIALFGSSVAVAGDAHVHGAGQLNLVLDQNQLALELTLAGMDVVGFEHKPTTEEQTAAVHQAVALLKDAGRVFTLPPAAGCQLDQADVTTVFLTDHEHEHEHEHEKDAAHKDFSARYTYTCADPAALTAVTVQVFALFPATETLAVQLVTATGQGAQTLNPHSTELALR